MKSRCALTVAMSLYLGTVMTLCLTSASQAAEQQTTAGETPSGKAPFGKIEYDSGYFATAISIPDDPIFLGITNITLECPELTGQGGTATISIRNSKATFNDFGDAEVSKKREIRQFEVTLKPIPAPDMSNEGRLIYNLVFSGDQWKNRIYFVWSRGTITASRLLIRRGEGKLPGIVIKTGRHRMDNTIGLTQILPSIKPIPENTRSVSEDVPEELTLRSYHFQSIDVSRPEGNRQGHISIYGKLKDQLRLTHDLNHTSFTPFGDGAASTLAAYAQRTFKVTKSPTKDPAGLGRRLLKLEYQGRNLSAKRGGDSWRPSFDYSLVLAPKIDGPHRLIIRQQDKIRHVLPLFDSNWRRYQQKQTVLTQTTQEEQDAIAEMRRRFGNRLSFEVQEGQVIKVSFQGLVKMGTTLAELEHLPHLKHLRFGGCRDLTAEELQPLAKLTHLEWLLFYGTPISDDVMEYIASLKQLKYLRVYDETRRGDSPQDVPHISDEGLKSLADLEKLHNLSLYGNGVTDVGLKHLSKLTGLNRLYFHKTNVTTQGLIQLSEQLPNTKIDASFIPGGEMNKTYSFNIHRSKQSVVTSGDIDDKVLKQLAPLRDITKVRIGNMGAVTNEGLSQLFQLENLENLDISHSRVITDAGLNRIKLLTKLQHLKLWYCRNITDEGLGHLHQLAQLKSLNLGGTQVTPAGIASLQTALPDCKIKK